MNAPTVTGSLAQEMTPVQIEEVVVWLATLPLAELRKRQAIHRAQITLAYEQGKDAVCHSEQIRADMVTDAISRKVFGAPQGGFHSE